MGISSNAAPGVTLCKPSNLISFTIKSSTQNALELYIAVPLNSKDAISNLFIFIVNVYNLIPSQS